MKHSLPSLRTVALLLFVCFLGLLLLTHTPVATSGVEKGLSLCMEILFPSLFPFLVLSELLVSQGAGGWVGKPLARPAHALLGITENGTAALLLGMICGLPVGTTIAVGLCERGEMTRKELHRLMLFANNPGAGFLIGAVGEALFGMRGAGVALFLITWLSAAAVGITLRALCGTVGENGKRTANGARKAPCLKDLTGSVTRGFFSLFHIFSFVIFFSCISTCLSALPTLANLPAGIRVTLYGMLEMTSGIGQAVTAFPPETAFRFTVFFANFAGLSVFLQLFAVAESQSLHPLPYLGAKLMQGGIALVLAEIYLRIFRPCFNTRASIATFAENPIQQGTTLGVAFLVCMLLLCSTVWSHRRCHRRP